MERSPSRNARERNVVKQTLKKLFFVFIYEELGLTPIIGLTFCYGPSAQLLE
jgi:hypothetical protein